MDAEATYTARGRSMVSKRVVNVPSPHDSRIFFRQIYILRYKLTGIKEVIARIKKVVSFNYFLPHRNTFKKLLIKQ